MPEDTWTVLVTFEGPEAEGEAGNLIAASMANSDVGLVCGGPGFPGWDINDTGPGWETHSYNRAVPDEARPSEEDRILEFLQRGKDVIREAFTARTGAPWASGADFANTLVLLLAHRLIPNSPLRPENRADPDYVDADRA